MSSAFPIRAFALTLMAAAPLPALACSGRVHIELEHAGVYALDHAAIVAAQPGLADCAADELVLTQGGKEVPLRVVSAGPRFAAGDRIEWIGQPLHGPQSWYDQYSINNVYLLGAAPGPHRRLRDAEATGSGRAALERRQHLEQENLMIRLDQTQQKPGEEPDVWQWAKLTHIDPNPFETRFDLPDLDVHAGAVRFELDFRGLSEVSPPFKYEGDRPDDHAVEVAVNGRPLKTLGWNGRGEQKFVLEVPAAQLKARENTLGLRVPKRPLPWASDTSVIDVVMFNWLETLHPLAGDLDAGGLPLHVRAQADRPLELAWRGAGAPVLYGSDGVRRPGRLQGPGRYAFAPAPVGAELFPVFGDGLARPVKLRAAAENRWGKPDHAYDYLIVSHPTLIDAIRPLAEFHEKRGLKVAVLDIDAVYDEFNHGITHPQAVRNLVDTAWHSWPEPRPRFLLLVGDSSFDIRHDAYNDGKYAKWVNQELLYPNAFGTIASGRYSEMPKSLGERNLIPTWQFPSPEGQSASDNWFAAVDGDDWHPVVAVGRFPVVKPEEVKAIVDKTIDYLSKPQLGAWRRDVMFITDEIQSFKHASDEIATALGKEGFLADKVYASPEVSENAVHQSAIRDGIDDGRLLVHFIGHGGRYIWRTGPPDLRKNNDLFTLDDVGSLNNGGRLPMVLSMTCYSAPFDNPTEDSIGERFLREPDKGAVAVFAASWRNSPSPAYSKSIISELLTPGATIGEAIVRGKKQSKDRILVEMYNLLGDPAVVLERPRDNARVMRDDSRWNEGVVVDLQQPGFDGNVRVDWLDAKGAKLASADYRVGEPRFRLPVPPGTRQTLAQVRVYAASPTSGRDAVGGVDFDPPPPVLAAKSWRASLADWWREATRPPYQPPAWHEDTIMQVDFDDPDPARTAALRAARRAAEAKAAATGSP
ncbi:C25 family cysteine peptidase [Dokdonella sp.]|uniref:C25 family cysteine peptidase n=1 Tax=Dokdonella sp. TaxID=2291710 RepID=UPI0026260166|nr:C25 family cysteine peptidase [Dokdonella sp.]